MIKRKEMIDMPNWCFNEISIECSEEEAKKIMEEIKGPNGDVDYNKIIPMPITIPRCYVNEPFLIECLAAFCTISNVPWPMQDIIQDPFMREIYTEYINKKYVVSRYPHDIMYLIGQLVYYNIITNGYLAWHDWSNNNWGVKWNASNSEVWLDKGKLSIIFDSPWWTPDRVLEQLSKNHQNAEFKVDLSGELDRDYHLTLQNGIWRENGEIIFMH